MTASLSRVGSKCLPETYFQSDFALANLLFRETLRHSSKLQTMELNSSRFALWIFTLFYFVSGSLAVAIEVVAPRTEYLQNPLGIDEHQPRLSWKLESKAHAQSQSAYRILVASSSELLGQEKGDLWDSGKVASDESIQVVYEGKPPVSRQRLHWKVMVWNQDDEPSKWSEPALWSMGLLQPDDWQAKWIGYDAIPEEEPAKPFEIVIEEALYGVPGDATRQVDVSEKIRTLVAARNYRIKTSNEFAGSDPADGVPKKLVIKYSVEGEKRELVLAENRELDLLTGNAQPFDTKRYLPSPHLRKEFAVEGKVGRAMLFVSAEGVFQMQLNGQRVGDEFFMPGWTDYRKRIYYRAYDVTELLREGGNALGGILGDGWFRGNISILGQNQYGDRLRLLSQLHIDYEDGRNQVVASDPTWKASFGPIVESDMQAGEAYDARLEMPGWDEAGFDDAQWAQVDVGAQLSPAIEAYPGVPVRRMRELATVTLSEPVAGRHVFDLGQNFSGWIRLKVSGKAGDKVVMRFGEMLNPDETVYTENLRSARATDTYILKGDGEEIWEPHFTFHGFRYVEISEWDGPVSPEMVTGIVVHSDAPLTSSFECSNPMLNQLHSNVLWGQLSNYLEIPTDCPQRDERLGWTGDTQVYIRTGTYHQDVAAFFKKWMVDLEDSINEAGIYGNQAPVFHGNGSPGWSDAGIICPWTIYQVYGDKRIIEKHYQAMVRYLEACGRNGLYGLRDGFGDWLAIGSDTPKDVISVAYYAYCAHLLSEMASVIGKADDAQRFQELFARICEHFQKSFVDEEGRVQGHTQTGYCMALSYDLLTEEQRQQAAAHLVERIEAKDYHLSVGFLGVPILLPTLTEIGRSDLAYRLLQNTTYPSWGYSVEQGATTIWERWNSYTKEGGITTEKMNSFNHYAYGVCSEWMFATMLGIDLAKPSFKKIEMAPEIGHGVTWAKGHYDSIHGRIVSDWKIEGEKLRWKVTIPANTEATLSVPAAMIEKLMIDGKGTSLDEFEIQPGDEEGRLILQVKSGSYELVASGLNL